MKERYKKQFKEASFEQIKNEFKDAIRKVAKPPIRISGFKTDGQEIDVLYNTPREYRHMDEYGEMDDKDYKKYQEFLKVENAIFDVLEEFNKKYPDYNFESGSDISGGGFKSF